MTIRLARPEDASLVLDIYAPYVRDTSLSFELSVPTTEEMAARMAHYLQRWPWLVAEENGEVAGYAYASQYREREGYQWSVECSIYIHDAWMGSGIARQLYQRLFDLLKYQGYRNVYAVINLPNDRSVAFHERMGFRYQFTFEKVGYKLGQWKNVGWWLLTLNSYSDEPAKVLPFADICRDPVVTRILEK